MKKIALILTAAMAMASTSAIAGAMTPKTVHYTCQGGKELNVTYSFNARGLPTKAVATLNGAKRTMRINLANSDASGTTFGKERSYMLGTDGMTSTNYNQVVLSTVTAPNNRIIYKDCSAN